MKPVVALLVLSACVPFVLADWSMVSRVSDAASSAYGRVVIQPGGEFTPVDSLDAPVDQMPGWPITIPLGAYFAPTRGLVLADLNGDGPLEVIAQSTANQIYAWDYTGKPLPGFPVDTFNQPQYAPDVADLDGDGDVEIVFQTRGLTDNGRLYVIDGAGKPLPGFPKNINNHNLDSCAALYDLDADGRLEIIVNERSGSLGYVHIVRYDGSEWGGNWPLALDHVPAATPAVGDVDNDGSPEILAVSYNSLYLVGVDGKVFPGWPKQIPNANFSYQSAVLADLDGDGDREIVVGAHKDAAGCYIFHHDGSSFPGWPQYVGTWTYCPPTVTDLEGDGALEVMDGRAGGVSGYSNYFYVWDTAGNLKPGFPYGSSNGGGSEGPLTVADINGDGVLEIFADCNKSANGLGFLIGVDASGKDLPGFPLRPQGFTYMNGAVIADVDLDGDYELGVLTYANQIYVNLYTVPNATAPTARDWRTYHGRYERGGRYPTATLTPGDMNCDGSVDFGDINVFVLALSDPAGYQALYPDCDILNGDINGDGVLDFGDINPFVELLSGS